MKGSRRPLVISASALLLAISAGAVPTWAHSRQGPPATAQTKGLVTSVGGTSLRVQTWSGSSSFTLNSDTRLTRLVNGSTADLAAGQTISAQFVSGSTTTFKSIRIEQAHQRQHGSPPLAKPTGPHDANRPPSGSSRPARNGAKPYGSSAHPPIGVEGQIVSLSAGSVTVKTKHGQSVPYQLANNVAVSKILPGRLSDLSVGEMVQVTTNRGSTIAISVSILSS